MQQQNGPGEVITARTCLAQPPCTHVPCGCRESSVEAGSGQGSSKKLKPSETGTKVTFLTDSRGTCGRHRWRGLHS